MKRLVVAVIALALSGGAAHADWTGPYGGFQLGIGEGDVGGTDFDGILGGAHVGVRTNFGSWVIGGEIDYTATDFELDGGAGSVDEVGRLKLQAGVDMGNSLVYGVLGAAYAEANVGGNLYDTGWVAGAGYDVKIGPNMTAGVEYLYHEFEDFDGSGSDVTANTLSARIGFSF